MAHLEGERLGNYDLLQLIGVGGMAEVYRARQRNAFGRDVAVKVIKRGFADDRVFRERFLREGQATSRLSHPHILPLIELGQTGHRSEQLFLVMPYIAGGTLRDLLGRTRRPLPLQVIERFFGQLCEAVQHAHERGLIHRDIKPSNILLQNERNILLADFGIALDTEDSRLTSTGVGMGTAEYTAPEQARGYADGRSDLYSLGIVLFEMLTGHLPFTGRTSFDVLFQQATAPVPSLRDAGATLEALARLDALLQRALAKNPAQRFQSAAEFNAAFQAALLHTGAPETSSEPLPTAPTPAPADTPAEQAERDSEAAAPDGPAETSDQLATNPAREDVASGEPAAEGADTPPAFLPLPLAASSAGSPAQPAAPEARAQVIFAEDDPGGERPTLLATPPPVSKSSSERSARRRQIALIALALLGIFALGGGAVLLATGLLPGHSTQAPGVSRSPSSAATATLAPQPTFTATRKPAPSATATLTATPTLTPTVSATPSPTTTPTPQLAVTPTSLAFRLTLLQCLAQPPSHFLTIQNTGGSALTWQASVQQPALLTIAPNTGSLGPTMSGQMTVTLNCPKQPIDTTDNIHFTSTGGTVDVTVFITVT